MARPIRPSHVTPSEGEGRKWLVVCAPLAALALSFGGACQDEPLAPGPDSSASASTSASGRLPVPLSDEQQAKAAALATALPADGYAFSNSVQSDPAHAELFLHLAATHAKPGVIAAALRGMAETWTHAEHRVPGKKRIIPAYHTVVHDRLGHDDPQVLAAALHAAANCVGGRRPNEQVITKLAAVAREHAAPAARYAALQQLQKVYGFENKPEGLAPFVAALDSPTPFLVAGGLQALRLRKFGLGQHAANLGATLRKLTRHADPGIRGRATELLGVTTRADAATEVAVSIVPLLRDEHPYVRASAAIALGRLGYRPAIHRLITMVDDDATTAYALSGWTRLDGTPGRVHHDVSTWSRVDDAALRALGTLSQGLAHKLTYRPKRKHGDKDIVEGVSSAKKWYAKVEGQLPPLPTSEPPTDGDAGKP